MKTSASRLLIAILFAGCAATAVPSGPHPVGRATVRIIEITPPDGAGVNIGTVIDAQIEYTIENFHPAARYVIAPVFSQPETTTTFSMLDRITDGTHLTKPAGKIRVRYPIEREIRSGRLATSFEVTFNLMQLTGKGQALVIGQTERLTYLR
jgi:hypothetical protein